MALILGVIVVAFLVFLVVGAITGRVTVTPCSAVDEPHVMSDRGPPSVTTSSRRTENEPAVRASIFASCRPRHPHLVGAVQHGVVYTGGTKKIAERGGMDPQDRHVPIVVAQLGNRDEETTGQTASADRERLRRWADRTYRHHTGQDHQVAPRSCAYSACDPGHCRRSGSRERGCCRAEPTQRWRPTADPVDRPTEVSGTEIHLVAGGHHPAGRRSSPGECFGNARTRFALTISNEAGKPITAARTEVIRAVDTLELSAEAARNNAGRQVPLDAVTAGTGLVGFEMPQPRGIVAAITPFNFPLNLVAHKLGPAIAAGCPVVIKPSEQTPMTAALLTQAFHDAGLPAGRLNLVTGRPADVVQVLLEDPRVAVVTFTGSAELGWAIKAKSPNKHHILELGSNTAMVVEADANLDQAVAAAVSSSFTFAGQACISLQRIYLQHTIEEDFLARFTKAAADLPSGDPSDEKTVVGPLITTDARDRVARWIDDAVAEGATLHTGGTLIDGVLPATVLSGVPSTAALICEEASGPVVSVIPDR